MNFSMDGFRKQLNVDLGDLKAILERVVAGKNFDVDDLAESFNIIVQHSNMINCVYDEGDASFSDLSHIVLDEISY